MNKTWILAGISALTAIGSDPYVNTALGLLPPPYMLGISLLFSGATIAKRFWFPSKPSEKTLTNMAQTPAFVDTMIKVLEKPTEKGPASIKDGCITIDSKPPEPGTFGVGP